MKLMRSRRLLPVALALAATAAGLGTAQASSHREAPFITTRPKVDGTDFYMFRSYEASRLSGEKFVTLIANWLPLQDPYGGPNYFSLDKNALYEIHIDNDGDAKEDVTFQFRFKNNLKGIELPIGGKNVAIPIIQAGAVADPNAATLNLNEQYTVDIVRGDRRTGNEAEHHQRRRRRRGVRQAGGQHRHEDDRGLRRLREQARLQHQHPRLPVGKASCSSGRGRKLLPSTWDPSSTWSTRRSA